MEKVTMHSCSLDIISQMLPLPKFGLINVDFDRA